MTPRITPRPPTYSTATLESLVCPLPVEKEALQSCLPPHARLSLPRLADFPEGYHPVIVEIWRVQNGLIEIGGVTAHRLWELASGAAGFGLGGNAGAALGASVGGMVGAAGGGALGMWLGPLGWWWGAATGASAGAAAGAATMAPAGAMLGARLGADAGRRVSETNSRVIGTYNEIIVTVPCRRAETDGRSTDLALVLCTYTDSTASMLGEWLVGWGFRKTRGAGTRSSDSVLEVSAGPAATPFRLVSHQASSPRTTADARSTIVHVLSSLSHPLLGVLPTGRLAVSFLDRSFEDAAVQVTPTSVRMESGDAFVPRLRGLATDIEAIGDDNPWGAFVVTGLPVTLSYPHTIEE